MAFYGYGSLHRGVYPEVDRRCAEQRWMRAPFCLHSLYGVIVDENDGPHPYLDNANEWLDAAVPYTFERRETFSAWEMRCWLTSR